MFSGLSAKQREAVEATEGPLLILAGAGSGKTKTLTTRIAYLISECEVSPFHILAITFTNKAARELQERIAALVGPAADRIWARTFHSTCLQILRFESKALEIEGAFAVYDDGDQLTLMKRALKECGIVDFKAHPPRSFLNRISAWKNELVRPEDLEGEAKDSEEALEVRVYAMYQRMLRANNAMDFDDLIAETVYLFKARPDILDKYRERFRYILVDEYQDTNFAQNEFILLLAEKYRNICVVGDDDQSIYGWRGADIRNILDFESVFPDAKTIKLEQNYRSTPMILDAANAVIKHNFGRKGKELYTEQKEGESLVLYSASDDADEGYFIVRQIRQLRDQYDFKDLAVLCRTTAQFRPLEECFIRNGLPYQVYGGVKFYQRKEIKDAMAYLSILANPADQVNMRRALLTPRRGIGEGSIDKLEAYAAQAGLSILEAMRRADQILSKRLAGLVLQFVAFYDEAKACQATHDLSELFAFVMDQSGYIGALVEEGNVETETRLDNIEQLQGIIKDFQGKHPELEEAALATFLAEVSLYTDMDQVTDDKNAVSLLTLHSAKGLEFPVVFMCGMEENIFPHIRSMGDDAGLEEERRLCYVGITRAKERLYLTRAQRRLLYGRASYNEPSRFLDEIPSLLVNDLNRSGRHEPIDPNASIETYAKKVPSAPAECYNVGDRVHHDMWGDGVITGLSGEGDLAQIAVTFPKVGPKKLIAKYAPIHKVNP